MKRFKAVVIGGSGYGGAEMIRRLLIHPDVELVRVVSVDHVGELLGAAHPPLTGRTALRLENVPLAGAANGCGVVHVVGITGSSGSGVVPSSATHHPVRAVNLKTYKALEHQHTPEIDETLVQAGARGFELRFVPVSAPLSRGILATSFVEVAG